MADIEVTLIKKEGELGELEKEIIDAINGYLLRNKEGVSDFNLIKDITQRSLGTAESEIDSMIPIPLYLGLAGTMIGIIVGLFSLPEIESNNFESSIDVLIGGVKIAMIASFTGLILTVLNSGYLFKKAKTDTEKQVNDFYTFLQTELLPAISQNLSASIYSLQSNLVDFNSTFKRNIEKFDSSLDNITTSFRSQVELLNELKGLDMVAISKFNVKVLAELRKSTEQFEKFNTYLVMVNTFVDNAERLNLNISNQLNRTVDLEEVAGEIKRNIDLNKSLLTWLKDAEKEMSLRKDGINSVVLGIDGYLEKSFDELKIAMTARIQSIIDISTREDSLLEKLFVDKRGNFDELKKLTAIDEGVKLMGEQMREQNRILESQVKSITKLNTALRKTTKGADEVVEEDNPPIPPNPSIPKIENRLFTVFVIMGMVVFLLFIIQFVVDFVLR